MTTQMAVPAKFAPASDAQKDMIRKLRAKKATDTNPIMTDEQIDNLLKVEVTHWRNLIWNMPWPAKKVDAASAGKAQAAKFDMYEDIVDGNYAYHYNGKTHFYRVTRAEGKGKWEGQTFVNVQERASDELYRIYDRNMKSAILAEIRKIGPEICQKLFAEKLDRCWRCGKSLTDEFNPYKPQGLGPDCGTKI